MPLKKTELKKWLDGFKKVAILGVGSGLRQDDNAGTVTAKKIEELIASSKISKSIKIFLGETAPENLSGQIREFRPTHIIIIDSADMGLKPGETRLVDIKNISGISFSTHRMPLSILAGYFTSSFDCKVMLIGIQPYSIEFSEELSGIVSKAVGILSKQIAEVLTKIAPEKA